MKEKAEAGENAPARAAVNEVPLSITPRLETTISLAISPLIIDTAAALNPNPRGVKMGDINSPVISIILFPLPLFTCSKLKEKFESTQIIMDEIRIMVAARDKKSFILSQSRSARLFG